MANVDLLCIVNEERKKFGLRDSDFHRYRIHCTHKLKTLRKSTGLQQSYNPKTKQFIKRSAESLDGTNEHNLKHFLINLFQVEHVWASSRELKEEVQSILKKHAQQKTDQATRTGASRVRHHANNRLTKAIQHSDRFLDLCHSSNSFSIRTLAQVHVHRLYMRGLLEFELARWDTALDHFALSCVILKALASSTDQTDHKKRAIFDESSDELAPMIRYCAYKSGANALEIESFSEQRLEKNPVGDKLAGKDWPEIESLVKSSRKIVQQTIELKWLDQLIPIRNPELVDLITSVQTADRVLLSNLKSSPLEPTSPDQSQAEEHLSRKQKRQRFLQAKNPKMSQKNPISPTAAFDQALSTYVNVETALQALIESNNRALELNSTIQRFDQQSAVLATIHSIVGFRLLSTRVNRDLELVHKLEQKWRKVETKVDNRINGNPKNYHQINRLVLAKHRQPTSKTVSNFNHQRPSSKYTYETDLIKSLLIQRRQAKIFPSLLKLFDDILFNLERIKQLKLIEDDHELGLKIESKISFFKAYRSLIQSKSWLIVEKFLESYVLQQKSNFYLRQTKMNLEEMNSEEEALDGENALSKREISDLNAEFFRFERVLLEAVSDEVQEHMRQEIANKWWKSTNGKEEPQVVEGGAEGLSRVKLEKLSLNDVAEGASGKPAAQVFDLAFNYATQFEWDQLDPNPHSPHASKTQTASKPGPQSSSGTYITTAAAPQDPPAHISPPQDQEPGAPAPAKKSGGLWSFFSRS
ncbi:hypothetical protein PtB15_17B137 [Puccinia triticina]|nr:hypothetical protein PtB15_17B137 [Puccinia triticina]